MDRYFYASSGRVGTRHMRNKSHNRSQMSSLLFWQFLHSISVWVGRHYLFWPPLFVLAISICFGRHYLLTDIEWRISQNNNDNICLLLCLLFLIWHETTTTGCLTLLASSSWEGFRDGTLL